MGAGSFRDQFMDEQDGWFDTSDWLATQHGFLPVPIIITEPAIGYGGGAALLFFHGRGEMHDRSDQDRVAKRVPPSVSAAFGFATENGTWGAGGQHFGVWRNDRIRTLTIGAYSSANIKFYPFSFPVEVNLAGFVAEQDVTFRILDSDFFLGARYRYSKVSAKPAGTLAPFIPLDVTRSIGGLGLLAEYDSRDNIFTPNDGQQIKLAGDFNNPGFGGDSTWWELGYQVHSFHQLFERLVVSLRFDGKATWGDVPFYAQPYVQLRGVPAMRYQGAQAGEGEIDIRWNVWERFSLTGFFGMGWAAGNEDDDNGPFPAGGGGFRYLIARKLGMQTGIDVARGPEDWAFYIVVGSPW
jgi:hypothetical protein